MQRSKAVRWRHFAALEEYPDAEILRIGAALKPIVQAADVAFILNDRPDLAAQLDADGVHVGQSDASYEDARRLMGRDRIVGVTCHNSRDLAYDAAEAGLITSRSALSIQR